MKQPLIRTRSTAWREWRDSVFAFAVIGVMFFIADHWHFVETKWRAVSVIVEVAISAIALCVFGLVVRTASSLFWPVMYALVAWHRERAAKRDATMVPKEHVPATFSSNLRSELSSWPPAYCSGVSSVLASCGVSGLAAKRSSSLIVIPPPITILTPDW
jgi:hypothetical protein